MPTIPIGDFEEEWASIVDIPDQSDSSFEASWDEEWRLAIIDAATEKTKAKVEGKQFQIFDLCTLRGWSAEKTADTLKIPRRRVYVSNHRVNKVFEQELKSLDLEIEL